MTTLTNAQRAQIIETAIATVKAGGHGSITDVISEVRDDCKALGLSDTQILNLFLDVKFGQIKVSV